MTRFAALALLVLAASPASAQQFDFRGYADFRLVLPAQNERSWLDGGLGKLRYGANDDSFQFAGAVGEGTMRLTPEISAVAVVRAEPEQRNLFDALEAYVRYRPVSTTSWRWSLKAGAFFAPMSLENTEIGWSPYWTITPSAINSWFGDELRTIGAEVALEWRDEAGQLTFTASGFGDNDPAGVLIAERGWSLDDRPTGLLDRLRQPDAAILSFGGVPPERTPLFKEIDNHAGWYAGAAWEDARQWRVELYRYDNEGDPAAHSDEYFAWRTQFWDAGASARFDEFTFLAQALAGSTAIAPSPAFTSTTDYDAAYALVGWERGEWRLAARADLFHTRTYTSFGGSPQNGENGYAFTAAVNWLPNDWLKLSGELLSVTSKRGLRVFQGLDPQQTETQAQFAAKIYLE